jgi:hypothetical protein
MLPTDAIELIEETIVNRRGSRADPRRLTISRSRSPRRATPHGLP